MPAVSTRRQPTAEAQPDPLPLFEPTPEQLRDVMTLALATLQGKEPTWRKADLIRCLGELLPNGAVCRDDQTAAALLEDLAEQVLTGKAGPQVLMLTAPEWPLVPDSLRRADGRSVYRPHRATKYATLEQLTIEDQLIARAQERGAPSVSPGLAARLLGATQAQPPPTPAWRSRSPAQACAWTRPPPRSPS
jgi:hypothetical protein